MNGRLRVIVARLVPDDTIIVSERTAKELRIAAGERPFFDVAADLDRVLAETNAPEPGPLPLPEDSAAYWDKRRAELKKRREP